MKTIKYFFAVSLVYFTFISPLSAQQISKAELQVNGLTCSMCSKATETSLRSLGFIESITPDLNRNVFVLTFKKGRQVDIDQIADKVQDAGFSIGELMATINFSNTVINSAGIAQADGKVYQFVNAKGKTLNGPVNAKVIDKDFVAAAVFKKNAAELKSPAYLKGRAVVDGKDTRILHLSI